MSLSICIPTFNRPIQLENCLNSLALQTNKNFEVCVSDNNSSYKVKKLINTFKKKLNIRFSKNNKNIGFAKNLLKATSMARKEFIWLLGDDDLLINSAVDSLLKKIEKNYECDFFWVNSFYLNHNKLKKFPHPFNTKNLPKRLRKHSNLLFDKKLNFFDLIDYRIGFDYLLGIFLCVFRREKWNNNLKYIDQNSLKDLRTWSNFENTCFHVKIFCKAFKKSKAFFCVKPLSVSLHGVREWDKLYPFIEIIRIPEVLDCCRKNGMKLIPYLINKNYSLKNFFNYFYKILIGGKDYGLQYVNFKKHFFYNLIFPNSWLSIIYFLNRRIKLIK